MPMLLFLIIAYIYAVLVLIFVIEFIEPYISEAF